MAKRKKEGYNVVYSTNPDYDYSYEAEANEINIAPNQQSLFVSIDRKQRGGKEVTIVEGFIGSSEELKTLAKYLKSKKIKFLMKKLIIELPEESRFVIVGTAIIIFVFRAMPGPGPGLGWFEIDVLDFDQQFFSVLSLIASALTLVGIVIFRPFMAKNSIAKIIVILSIVGSILFLPSVGMYYGFHNWTSSLTNGVVDARFIAIVNTALESPLGQVSMIPLLAWIAKNAPAHLKATFFAIFASFTNLALSANALGTKYLNEIFIITRAVKDKVTDAILSTADYSELGLLLIIVTVMTLCIPIVTVWVIQQSKFKTDE